MPGADAVLPPTSRIRHPCHQSLLQIPAADFNALSSGNGAAGKGLFIRPRGSGLRHGPGDQRTTHSSQQTWPPPRSPVDCHHELRREERRAPWIATMGQGS